VIDLVQEVARKVRIEYPKSECSAGVTNWSWACGRREKPRPTLPTSGQGERWKIELAVRLRRRIGAPYRWILASLNICTPVAVRRCLLRL
jgi:hypothetical protein